jgi:mono/diheme cytochrome c family protein
MVLIRHIVLLVGFMLCVAVFSEPQQKQIKYVPIQPTSPASGQNMYTTYCAVCHGVDAKGSGPAADALKVPPPDLTGLARRNGGKFPFSRVANAIQVGPGLPVRSGEMPAWGDLFWSMSDRHSSEVQLRVTNLTDYIGSLQAK